MSSRAPDDSLGKGRGLRHLTIGQTLSRRRNGGLVEVLSLHEALLDQGFHDELAFVRWPDVEETPRCAVELECVLRNPFFFGWGIASRLSAAIRSADVVHVHGLYTYLNWCAGWACRKWGKPLVYHPHGTFAPEFMRLGRFKKMLATRAFERRNFETVDVWRALSAHEAEQIRRVDSAANVVVIPNGVQMPAEYSRTQGERSRLGVTADASKRVFLFLSRLSAAKGIDLLVDAWRAAGASLSDCELWIAGTSRDDTEARIREQIRAGGCQNIHVIGAVSEDEKAWLYRACDVFVLTSRGEGQSPAILEAMAFGNPVMVTRTCYFEDAASHGAGFECGVSVAEIQQTLVKLAEVPEAELEEMGQRGRALVDRSYSIDRVARSLDREMTSIVEARK